MVLIYFTFSEVLKCILPSVQKAEAEEHLSPRVLLAAFGKELGVGDRVAQVGAEHVGAQALWRLVGHLDAVLQDEHREGGRGVLK